MQQRYFFPVIIFSLAIVLTQTLAQDRSNNKTSFAVRTSLLVLNEKDEFVDDIKASDVNIFEDGIQQKLTYFSAKKPGINISLVIDNSGSVRTQLDDVIDIGKVIVTNLTSSDEAAIIRFVSRDQISIEGQWTANKSELISSLDDLYISAGQSAVIDALYLATEDIAKRQQADKSKRYAIILISDGEDRDSYYKLKDLLKLYEKTDIQIFTIALTKELSSNAWVKLDGRKTVGSVERLSNKIAARTGGTSFLIGRGSTADDLRGALRALMIELRSQYIVGYETAPATKDTSTRKLSAIVADGPNGEKRKAIIKYSLELPVN